VTTIDTIEQTVEALCGDLSNIRAPRGTELNGGSWSTEAPLRMLLNNLDPEVAEHPEELIVYGGSGKAARNHEALRAIVRTLLTLGDDETLLVQSGKPVGVLGTHPGAPSIPRGHGVARGRNRVARVRAHVHRRPERLRATAHGSISR